MEDWSEITYADIPSRSEFEKLTIEMLRRGITNSDRMRDNIRRERKLKMTKATGRWNDSPSDKFVNDHAWALEELVVKKMIEKLADKEYRLLL